MYSCEIHDEDPHDYPADIALLLFSSLDEPRQHIVLRMCVSITAAPVLRAVRIPACLPSRPHALVLFAASPRPSARGRSWLGRPAWVQWRSTVLPNCAAFSTQDQ